MERVKLALAQARQQRENLERRARVEGREDHRAGDKPRPRSAGRTLLQPVRDLRPWLAPATAAIVITMLGWLIVSQDANQRIGINAPEVDAQTGSDTAAQLRADISASNQLRAELAVLQARMDLLVDSITSLDSKLTDVQALQERINVIAAYTTSATSDRNPRATGVPSVEQATAATGVQKNPAAAAIKVTDVAASEVVSVVPAASAKADIKKPAPAPTGAGDPSASESSAGEQTQADAGDPGQWVINVGSLPDQLAADRFAARARSKGIRVETNQAIVKGKTYWRVRVPGFASAEDAKAQADSIETKLGLKESWVSQR